jgi:uncharacterized protein (TIGR02246 family)
MLIRGKCHCGNIAFDLHWDPDPAQIPARACTCSFCRKHGGLWTSTPRGRLEVRIEDPSHVSRYAFGTKTADFHLCARCGVVPVVTSRIDGNTYAVVSVNAFEDVDERLLVRAPASFDGEGTEDRLERRKRNWIADVRFVERAASADEREIRELVSTWIAATKAGDIDTVLGLMTDDVVFLVPGMEPFGKAEFAAASRTAPGMARPSIEGASEIRELRIAGDLAYMWTRLSVSMTPPSGDTVERAGYTLTVLRREGGRWKLARDANLLAPVARAS